jgi:hypothetical protein
LKVSHSLWQVFHNFILFPDFYRQNLY